MNNIKIKPIQDRKQIINRIYKKLYLEFEEHCSNKYMVQSYKRAALLIHNECKVLKKFKDPLYPEQFEYLYQRYSDTEILDKLKAIENYSNAENKYTSIYWTLRIWLERDKQRKFDENSGVIPFNRKEHEKILRREEKKAEKEGRKLRKRIKILNKVYDKEKGSIASDNPLRSKYSIFVAFILNRYPFLTKKQGYLTFEDFEFLYGHFTVKQLKKGIKLFASGEAFIDGSPFIFSLCDYLEHIMNNKRYGFTIKTKLK